MMDIVPVSYTTQSRYKVKCGKDAENVDASEHQTKAINPLLQRLSRYDQ